MKFPFAFFVLIAFNQPASAQLTVSNAPPNNTPAALLNQLPNGIPVVFTNTVATYASGQIGTFNATNSNLGLTTGILLNTGHIYNAGGPSLYSGTSQTFPGTPAISPELVALHGLTTTLWDLCSITTTFTALSDSLAIRYVFGSNEYNTFGGYFNDCMGIFISGPNPAGGNYTNENLAWLNGNTSEPVSVDNLDCSTNSSAFVCNLVNMTGCSNCPATSSARTVGYFGFTTPQWAKCRLVPGAQYTIQFAVAEVSDFAYDSGLFIEAGGIGYYTAPQADYTFTIQNDTVFFDASSSVNGNQFTWNFGDGTSGLGQQTSHVYSTNGPWLVTLYAQDTLVGVVDSTVDVVQLSVGLLESLLEETLRVYPNPSPGSLHLEFELDEKRPVAVEVLSPLGKVLHSSNLPVNTGRQEHTLDLTALSSGVYFLRLRTDRGQVVRRIALR